MNGTNSPWTPDLDARLTTRWNDPDQPSTARIARELGVTKNAVIGRAHRLGLPKRPSPVRRGIVKRPLSIAHVGSAPAPIGSITDCKFIAADPHGMFARGDNPFCGQPTLPGSAYCGVHHKICYVRPRRERLAEIERIAARATEAAE